MWNDNLVQGPHLESQLLNRKPPFGRDIITAAQQLPNYIIEVTEKRVLSGRSHDPVEITLAVSITLRSANQEDAASKRSKGSGMTSCLVLTSDSHLVDFRRTP